MGRQTWRIVIVLGALITLLSGTGIFAVFSDRATTGAATITSGERARAADLKLALAAEIDGAVSCDPDSDGTVDALDDLVTPLFTAWDLQPGQSAGYQYLCLINAGSGALDATVTVIDLIDLEGGCTGDEEAAGDGACGPGDSGELSPYILINVELVECQASSMTIKGRTESPASYAATPWDFTDDAIEPGATACLRINSQYRPDVTEAQAQLAQTDQVTWRFAFDVTAS
jgi:hypothetical protein